MRFQKFHKIFSPGMYYINPAIDTIEYMDKKERVVDLKRQGVVSRDNMSFAIDAVLFYKVYDTYKARFAVQRLQESLVDLAITTMRNVVGAMTMQEFLEKKDEIDDRIEKEITIPASNWGARITHVLVQDVALPREFQATMASGAMQKKIGEARVIMQQADVISAKLQKEVAEIMNTDAALQIRYLQALEQLARSGNPKMVFFPSDYRDIGTVNPQLNDQVKKFMK